MHPPNPNYQSRTPEGQLEHFRIAAIVGRRLREVVVSPNRSLTDKVYLTIWNRKDEPAFGTDHQYPSKTIWPGNEGYYNFLPEGIVFDEGIVVAISLAENVYAAGPDDFQFVVKFWP